MTRIDGLDPTDTWMKRKKGNGWKSTGFRTDFSRFLIQPGISNFVECIWQVAGQREGERKRAKGSSLNSQTIFPYPTMLLLFPSISVHVSV